MKLALVCGLWSLLVVPFGGRPAFGVEEMTPTDLSRELEEMPVLTGEEWQTLQLDTKVAFIWGVGHVVTIEENVVQRHPELKRPDFTAKLAEGLRGVPMSTIIQAVDAYYRNNPDDVDMPVLRVVWRQLVKPKLKTGIADRPLATSQQ
ncbi:hypothetical protein [Geomonas limicola]|uniref:hypothetical protein n=1 Tax=Geomonas limicola TaxID=2740186 RepID=UPI00160DFEA4|nr:hypothetical protein [Geomonas limicola]